MKVKMPENLWQLVSTHQIESLLIYWVLFFSFNAVMAYVVAFFL